MTDCKCNSTSICKDHTTENVWAEIDRNIAMAEKANAETARVLEACGRLLAEIEKSMGQ